jgi:hypothetical protein
MLTCSPRVSATGSVSGAGVAMQTIEPPPRAAGPRGHRLDERFVAPEAVRAHNIPVPRGDLDRLLEVLEGEGHRVPDPVVGLGHPFRDSLVRQMALDAGRGVPVSALQPASYCGFMMWQFTHARGSVER